MEVKLLKLSNNLNYISYLILIGVLFILLAPSQKVAAAEPVMDTKASYLPLEPERDPWGGGNLILDSTVNIDANLISWRSWASAGIDFSIPITVPNDISPDKFVEALQETSYIDVGGTKVTPEKTDFTIDGDKIVYKYNSSRFNMWALIQMVIALFVGDGQTDITAHLEFSVNTLSANNILDTSKDNLVTFGKLPPNINNSLNFSMELYDQHGVFVSKGDAAVTTWSSYISPWNEAQATLDGKEDDTQKDENATEVFGIDFVLNGDNYQSREVSLPITEQLNPGEYIRTINFFTKESLINDQNAGIHINQKVNSQTDVNELNLPRLRQLTSYIFQGTDNNGIALSPVKLDLHQQTVIDMKTDTNTITSGVNEEIKVVGEFFAEGQTNEFYIKGADGVEKTVRVNSLDNNKIEFILPAFTTDGTYPIVLGFVSQYNLRKEVPLTLTIVNEEVKLLSISDNLNFGTHTIPEPGEKLQNQEPFAIEVLDTYVIAKQWKLYVKISKLLQTEQGEQLPGQIYTDDGQRLGNEASLFYQNESSHEGTFTPVNFEKNKGFYLQMDSSNVKVNTDYTGTLDFVLDRGPN